MDRLIRLLILLIVLFAGEQATAQTSCGTLSGCPNASIPLNGSEFLYVLQGGVSKKVTTSNFMGVMNTILPLNNVWTGTNTFNGGVYLPSFSVGLPLVGGAGGLITQGTRSGNTTSFATTSGTLTSGDCAKFDASGNVVDAGGLCLTTASGGAVNMIAYGADPTGAVDSCGTPLTNAKAALPAAGGVLYWPRGAYLCNEQISFSNIPIAIIGDGAGLSTLNFSSASANSAGIFISENATQSVKVYGLTLNTTVAQTNGNACISVAYLGLHLNTTDSFDNFECISPSDAYYWATGIGFTNVSYSTISNYLIKGKNESNPPGGISSSNMSSAIYLSGTSISNTFTAGHVVFANDGVYVTGDSERNYFTSGDMVAVNYGWYYDDGASSGDPTAIANMAGPSITGMHVDSYKGGVHLKGWNDSTIANNLFYKRSEGNVNWDGVDFSDGTYGGVTVGSQNNSVRDNTFDGYYNQSGCTCTVVAAFLGDRALSNNFSGNSLNNFRYAFDLGSGANTNFNYFMNNTWLSANQAWVTSSANAFLYGNFPWGSDAQTLTANSATPVVSGGGASSWWYTANTVATSVTNFVANGGGAPVWGQTITVIANDGNTTLVHGPTLQLQGGVNFVMSIGQSVNLQWNGVQWRELSRKT